MKWPYSRVRPFITLWAFICLSFLSNKISNHKCLLDTSLESVDISSTVSGKQEKRKKQKLLWRNMRFCRRFVFMKKMQTDRYFLRKDKNKDATRFIFCLVLSKNKSYMDFYQIWSFCIIKANLMHFVVWKNTIIIAYNQKTFMSWRPL